MPNITVKMKNGTVNQFPDNGRPGGSYCNSVRYEGAFVIVRDVWGAETAYPAADVEKVEKQQERRGW
jgi:hypothetical protein